MYMGLYEEQEVVGIGECRTRDNFMGECCGLEAWI